MAKRRMSVRRRRTLGWSVALLVAVCAVAGWLAARGLAAQDHLTAGRDLLLQVRAAVETGDTATATARLREAQGEAATARRLTSDPVWVTVGALPWIGATPRAVTTSAAVVDDITREVLPILTDNAESLDLARLRQGSGINLAPLESLSPALERARYRTLSAHERLLSVKGPVVPAVGRAVDELSGEIRSLASALDAGVRVSRLLPPMMGGNEPRRYLLAVQNPAESRGTGGLLGAYAVIEARAGSLSLRELGANSDLRDAKRLPVDLGPDYLQLYGQDPALWRNSNLSPHFPYAAAIWLALWKRQSKEQLDGVIAIDPILMGYLVGAMGGVTLDDGTKLNGDDTADFVMRDIYERFPAYRDSAERDKLLTGLGATVLRKLLSGAGDPRQLAEALARAVDEGRMRVYSTRIREQSELVDSAIGGTLADDRSPGLLVAVNNGAANKLDYYLDRAVLWELGPCADGYRRSRVTVTLTNRAPRDGLPRYVLGNRDVPRGGVALPPGTNRLLVYVYSTPGARVTGAELDGVSLPLVLDKELGRSVQGFTVDLGAGERRVAVLDLTEPALTGRPRLQEQPLVRPQRSVIKAAQCAK